MPHTDGKAYHPIVTNISMNSGLVINFFKNHEELREGKFMVRVYLEPWSLVVFKDDIYECLHTIENVDYDVISDDPNDKYFVNNSHLIDWPDRELPKWRTEEDAAI